MHVIFNQGTFILVCKADFIKALLSFNKPLVFVVLRLPFFQEYFAISHVVLMSDSLRCNYYQYYFIMNIQLTKSVYH